MMNDPARLNGDLCGHPQKAICRYSAILIYAFKGPLPEAAREPNQCFSDLCESAGSYTRAGSAMVFRRDSGQQHLLFSSKQDVKQDLRVKSSLEHHLFLAQTTIFRLVQQSKRLLAQYVHVERGFVFPRS